MFLRRLELIFFKLELNVQYQDKIRYRRKSRDAIAPFLLVIWAEIWKVIGITKVHHREEYQKVFDKENLWKKVLD